MKELQARVVGRVQRVMFRDFVVRNAKRLGVVGEVQNNRDGSVRVLAQGDEERIEKLVQQLHRGSLFSRVDTVETTWQDIEAPTHDDFVIIFNQNIIDRI